MKKILIPVFSLVLLLGMLAGCGGADPGGDKASITDAKSLAAANKTAQEAVKNFHADGDMDMKIKMTINASGTTQDLDMPMKMGLAMDTDGKTGHGQMKVDADVMGQSIDQDAEVYTDLEKGAVYTKVGGSDAWAKSDQQINVTSMMDSVAEMDESLLAKAEFAESEEGYTLTLSGDALGEALKDMDLMSGVSQLDLSDLTVGGGKIIYTIDKETNLMTKTVIEGLTITAKGSSSGVDYDADITMDSDYAYCKYDELKPADYEIPDEVLEMTGDKETAE